MSNNEAKLLVCFLNQFGDKLGNAGCNDMTLPNTRANRHLAVDAHFEDEISLNNKGNVIFVTDFLILDCLKRKLADEHGVDPKETFETYPEGIFGRLGEL